MNQNDLNFLKDVAAKALIELVKETLTSLGGRLTRSDEKNVAHTPKELSSVTVVCEFLEQAEKFYWTRFL